VKTCELQTQRGNHTRDGAKDHEAAGYKQAGETKDNGALEIFQDDEKLYRAHKGILWEKPKFK